MRVCISRALLVGLVFAGCAGAPPESRPLPAGPPALEAGETIGSVEISIDRERVAPNGVASLERYGIAEKLRTAVTGALGSRYADGRSDLVLHVEIDRFRLRSGGNAFWLGAMGGADVIETAVSLRRGEAVARSYTTDTSTVLGGIVYASPTRRSNRLVDTISERIVAGLQVAR